MTLWKSALGPSSAVPRQNGTLYLGPNGHMIVACGDHSTLLLEEVGWEGQDMPGEMWWKQVAKEEQELLLHAQIPSPVALS